MKRTRMAPESAGSFQPGCPPASKWSGGSHRRNFTPAGAATLAVAAVLMATLTQLPGSGGSDTASVAEGDVTLIPAQVSTTCGGASDPAAPFSGDASRAWVCPHVDGWDLGVLNIEFDKPVVISKVTITPGHFGYASTLIRGEGTQHRLPTAVSWRMHDEIFYTELPVARAPSAMDVPVFATSQMSLTVERSTPPSGESFPVLDSTAVSKIVITGYEISDKRWPR